MTEPTCTKKGKTVYTCSKCSDSYTSDQTSAVDHSYVNGKCSWCGTSEPVTQVDYYLIGYINGKDYGCESDSANMGQYKFADGKLTVTFESDSYVFIKTTGNANWYMTDGWLGTETTTATLYNTTLDIEHNKLFVPGGVEITFTLVVNEDDTLTLSYTVADKPIEKFDIAFAQIDMGNALGMNFAFPAVEGIDFTGAYAEATMAGSTQTIPATAWESANIGGAAHYVFGYSNISAKQMADEITIVIYNADGTVYGSATDSMASYIARMSNADALYECIMKFSDSAFAYLH